MVTGFGLISTGSSIGFSVLILLGVLLLTALRQIGSLRLQIWQIMTLGALSVLLLGEISPREAFHALNFDVLFFLFGAFCVGEALNRSGYLTWLWNRIVPMAKNTDQLILLVLFSSGLLSAILMNDTLAILGTPLVLHISRKYGVSSKLLLFALAFGITTGSVMSPIGNPQNFLIAVEGKLEAPFAVFLRFLALPSLLNLVLVYAVLRVFFKREFGKPIPESSEEVLFDPELTRIAKCALFLMLGFIACKILLVEFFPEFDFKLSYIALLSALPILLSRRRLEIVKHIDWATLVFFISMFVLMKSVWTSGTCQNLLKALTPQVGSVPMTLALSIGLSQMISNVPFVALYLPAMGAAVSEEQMMALAAGSTIAGNFLLLGAASNVIIIQNAEKEGKTLSFIEFARIGTLITFLEAIIYYIFL